MLLETSFCGVKSQNAAHATQDHGTKTESDSLEKVILSRKHDPTKAILAEGISVDEKHARRNIPEKPVRKIEKSIQNVKSDIKIKVDAAPSTNSETVVPKLPKTFISASGVEYTYIPLKGPMPIDPDESTHSKSKIKDAQNENRTKGTTPKNTSQKSTAQKSTSQKPSLTKSSSQKSTSQTKSKTASTSKSPKSKSTTTSPTFVQKPPEEPVYIRIKLKPDYMYDDAPSTQQSNNQEMQKPFSLNLNEGIKKPPQSFAQIMEKETKTEPSVPPKIPLESQGKSISSTPSASPKPARHNYLKEANVSSKSPSPSLSRKSSFASLFKHKEGITSPESPTVPGGSKRKSTLTGIIRDASESIKERRRSRSKSRERTKTPTNLSIGPSSTESIDSKGKQRSVFSLFKSKKTEKSKPETDPDGVHNIDSHMHNVEFTFNSETKSKKNKEKPLEAVSIRIPLHSPTYYENRNLLQDLKTSSQDSQETVIEASASKKVDTVVESDQQESESNKMVQSVKPVKNSTSSEKIVSCNNTVSENANLDTLETVRNLNENFAEKDICHGDRFQPHFEEYPREKSPSVKTSTSTTSIKSSRTEKVTKSAEYSADEEDIGFYSGEKMEADTSPKEDEVEVSKPSFKNRNSAMEGSNDRDNDSSESERDSDVDFFKGKIEEEKKQDILEVIEPERKGLVLQQDSFEDELPYVPTTLPLERSVAVPIVPVKQRGEFA